VMRGGNRHDTRGLAQAVERITAGEMRHEAGDAVA
jgi:hypothetical protein